jgi:hypothetical protein
MAIKIKIKLENGNSRLEAFALGYESTFQNDVSLLVSLGFIVCKLVDPAELRVAPFARNIAHKMLTSQHGLLVENE